MYNWEQLAFIKNNNHNTKIELAVIEEKINAGKLSKSDYYTTNTRNKSEEADLIEVQNNSLAAMNELKYLIGLNYHSPFDIKDIDAGEIKSISKKGYILSEVLEKALKDHPAILESMFNERAAEMNVKTAKGNLIPNVSLAGNVFSNYNLTDRNFTAGHIPIRQQLNNNFGKSVGIFDRDTAV